MRIRKLITAAQGPILTMAVLAFAPLLVAQEPATDSIMERTRALASQIEDGGHYLPAGTDEYRVGPGCTYSSIQDAIDAISTHGSGVIRIRSGTFTENLAIVNKSVDLLGGHSSCTSTDPTGLTYINASTANLPAIYVYVLGGPVGNSHSLHLSDLALHSGMGSNVLTPGGGLSVLTADDRTATVTLSDTMVYSNQSVQHGGGIALIGGGTGTLVLMDNSRIMFNKVTGANPYGGGLYCSGDYSVLMFGGSIYNNVAGEETGNNARGGGIYLDGCKMDWLAQTEAGPGDDAALRNNIAYGSGSGGGGGLFATGGAEANLVGASLVFFGDSQSVRPLRIHANRAQAVNSGGDDNGAGSAISAAGSGTRVRLDRAWVHDNVSGSLGTFYARDNAEIIVERGSELCHTPKRCSWVFNNSSRMSAVAFAFTGGKVGISRSIISGNFEIPSLVISSLFDSQANGVIEIRDSLVFGNSTEVGVRGLTTGAVLRVNRSTFSGNNFGRHVFHLTSEGSGTIFDSIIYEPGTLMAPMSSNLVADCVIWHDDQLGGSRTQVADPRFVDPDRDLFYLKSDSPAINYCDITPPNPRVDLDWNPRGLCHSTDESCGAFVYDLGAYEYPLKVFSDRFEAAP